MIIHYNHDKPTSVYVVNSRLPMYRAYYGDGLGNTIMGFFARIAPKVAPLAKQAGMKAIEVIRDKGLGVVGDLAGKAFSAVKDKITSLVGNRKRFSKQPRELPAVPLPSMAVMPARVSKIINEAVQEKLENLKDFSSLGNSTNIGNMIAGSGFKQKRRRR